MDNKPKSPVKGYGKRPAWQWVVIYLIVAAILYTIIYFVWIHKGDNSGAGSGYGY